jgi:hypothetical protein
MIIAMRSSKEEHKGTVMEICQCFGQTRDAYYKFKRRQVEQTEVFEKVIEKVKERRVDLPREGGESCMST